LAEKRGRIVTTRAASPVPSRLYGSASPSRVRRLLDHLERQGRIVVREDFGGARSISVPVLPAAA
jgi:hypothetical protein